MARQILYTFTPLKRSPPPRYKMQKLMSKPNINIANKKTFWARFESDLPCTKFKLKIASTSFWLGKISHCFSVDFDVAEDENWDNDICTRPCRLSVNRRGIYSQVSLKRGRQEMEKAIVGHRSRLLSACLLSCSSWANKLADRCSSALSCLRALNILIHPTTNRFLL